jgi:hypothetical protein
VLRRSATEVQVGLHPSRALILPDTPPVRALLDALASPGSRPPEEYDAPALALLTDAGLLADADTLIPLVARRPSLPDTPAAGRADVSALAALVGDAAGGLLEARAGCRVEVAVCGSPETRQVADTLVRLLAGAGVPSRPPEPRRGRDPGRGPAVAVLVSVGEPPREETDAWMREGTPHLLLRLTEGQAVLGPFVRPAETACLRCVDAHHTDLDPSWPLLVRQHADAVARERQDSVPEPVDSVLATLAAAWAARELVSHAEGREPATASTTICLDPHLTAL